MFDLKHLSLNSPNGKFVVTFSNPAFVDFDETTTPYQLITLTKGNQATSTLSNLRGTSTALAPYAKRTRWSLDGNYLLLTEMTEVDPARADYGHEFLKVLDLTSGRYVYFTTAEGISANFANFDGWKPNTPHTLSVLVRGKDCDADPFPEQL